VKLAGAILLVGIASAPGASAQKNPYRNYTEAKFVENMQTAGRNYAAVTDLLAKREYEPAKAQLTRAREQLAITITFWRDRKQDDAVKLLRDALRAMDDLDVTLSAEPLQPSDVGATANRVAAACEACHVRHREQDPATKAYRIKPGSLQ
jgi:hypothetical protein